MDRELLVYDDFLEPDLHRAVFDSLGVDAGWRFGARSDDHFGDRYFFKDFAADPSGEGASPTGEDYAPQLANNPVIAQAWDKVREAVGDVPLQRCYANAMSAGIEGSLHQDSTAPGSVTALYFPHQVWSPAWGGETLFWNGEEIERAIYPRPNRLVVFPSDIVHCARPMSRHCTHLRTSLMFKT